MVSISNLSVAQTPTFLSKNAEKKAPDIKSNSSYDQVSFSGLRLSSFKKIPGLAASKLTKMSKAEAFAARVADECSKAISPFDLEPLFHEARNNINSEVSLAMNGMGRVTSSTQGIVALTEIDKTLSKMHISDPKELLFRARVKLILGAQGANDRDLSYLTDSIKTFNKLLKQSPLNSPVAKEAGECLKAALESLRDSFATDKLILFNGLKSHDKKDEILMLYTEAFHNASHNYTSSRIKARKKLDKILKILDSKPTDDPNIIALKALITRYKGTFSYDTYKNMKTIKDWEKAIDLYREAISTNISNPDKKLKPELIEAIQHEIDFYSAAINGKKKQVKILGHTFSYCKG